MRLRPDRWAAGLRYAGMLCVCSAPWTGRPGLLAGLLLGLASALIDLRSRWLASRKSDPPAP